MKKKILGLLLALCLIIGLLPVAALAADDTAYVKVGSVEMDLEDGVPQYIKSNSDTNPYPKTTTDATEAAAILEYNKDAGKVTVTLKNATLRGNNTNSTKKYPVFVFGKDGNNNFSVEIVVEGACYLTTTKGENIITSNITGTLTIKDTGAAGDQLTLYRPSASSNAFLVEAGAAGPVVLDGVKINATSHGSYDAGVFNVSSLTIKNGSEVIMSSTSGSSIIASGNVLIENSSATFCAETGVSNQLVMVGDESTITIKNSTVVGATTAKFKSVFNQTPILDFSATGNAYEFVGSTENPVVTAATDTAAAAIDITALTPETTYTAGATYKLFAIRPCTHEGTLVDTDKDCTTGLQCPTCGTVVGTEFNANHTDPGQTDCTVKVTCSNPGCEVVLHEATTHTGGTATCIAKAVCTECGTAYGEFAAHTPKAGEYACSVAHPCAVEGCTANYREAGTHTGGTATCTKKAECSSCGAEYGELAAHTPEADDKDCTTAIKCSVCKAEVTAAKEHKYTDNADTTCDNAGCEHARKVDAPTTKPNTNNVPQTGDSFNMVLWVSLLAISVVGFVSLMVFRKKHA